MPPAPSSSGVPQAAPSKASLKAWWKQFIFVQKMKKEPAPVNPSLAKISSGSTVFGKPLRESLRYASVHISTSNGTGEVYVWGYIPVVVAKCGLYLKENATEIQGTFRVNGSNKRMRELQELFDTPPKYGKDLDWTKKQFTSHDVASVFRRFLTQMPEPVIPHDRYHDFRDVLAHDPPLSQSQKITAFKQLIQSLPRANQYLLLYVLDLLSVFARKSDANLMNAENLATVFRPGIINHPSDEMSPTQHKLSQQVLEFLIAQQDWFMMDVSPPTRRDSILGPLQPTAQDAMIVPTDKGDDPAEGRWKVVESGQSGSVDRRRTTIEKGSGAARRSSIKSKADDPQRVSTDLTEKPASRKRSLDLHPNSAMNEDDSLMAGAASVKRSTTAPSRHSSIRAPGGVAVVDPSEIPPNGSPMGSLRRKLQKPYHDSKFSTNENDPPS